MERGRRCVQVRELKHAHAGDRASIADAVNRLLSHIRHFQTSRTHALAPAAPALASVIVRSHSDAMPLVGTVDIDHCHGERALGHCCAHSRSGAWRSISSRVPSTVLAFGEAYRWVSMPQGAASACRHSSATSSCRLLSPPSLNQMASKYDIRARRASAVDRSRVAAFDHLI